MLVVHLAFAALVSFALGAITAILFYRWCWSRASFRLGFLRMIHNRYPGEYHLACELESQSLDDEIANSARQELN